MQLLLCLQVVYLWLHCCEDSAYQTWNTCTKILIPNTSGWSSRQFLPKSFCCWQRFRKCLHACGGKISPTYSTLLRKCLGPYLFPHPPQSWNIESESVCKEKTGLQLCLSARCSQTVWKQVEGWALLWLGLSWTSVNGVAAMRRKYFFVLMYLFFFFLFSLSAHLQLTFTGFFHKNGTFAKLIHYTVNLCNTFEISMDLWEEHVNRVLQSLLLGCRF